mmetsp:Transcript_31040/g.66064  ORF Transcript_31040/g.66064 Transcript_31040/m.66064 type:complete len:145 (+) Transcript_31040:106-540(+)
MSLLCARLLPYPRRLFAAAVPNLYPRVTLMSTPSSMLTNSNAGADFHTSAPLRRRGYKNPKIGITLEQLRMAARGQGRRLPICHAEQEKVMNALEAAKYENWAIYKYVKEYDKCREEYALNNDKGKDKAMMRELNKYLVRKKKK